MATDKHIDEHNDDMVLKPDLSITFGHKASLKRSEETGIPMEDEKVIAMMEGDTLSGKINTELAKIYTNTRLLPEPGMVYPDHASLKKKIVLVPVVTKYAAAAVILLLISVGAWLTFSPASSPARVQYDLATLVTRPAAMDVIPSSSIELESSSINNTIITDRKEFELSEIDLKKANQVQVLFASSISGQMSYTSLSNTQHPAPNTFLASTDEPIKRSLLGKVFNGMFNRVKAPFERSDAQAKPGPEKGFSIWDIAELGVKGVNTLGDHDYTLVRDYNEKGNVKRVILLDE